MEHLNEKGIILCLPKEDRLMLIGALSMAIEAHDEEETATEPTKESIKRLKEIRQIIIDTYKTEGKDQYENTL